MNPSPVLRFREVHLAYPRQGTTLAERLGLVATPAHPALVGIDLTVGAGEAVGVIGDNGAGKTTLLRTAAGVLTPDRGSVGVTPRVRPLLELGAGFDPHRSGWENAGFLAALLGIDEAVFEAAREGIEELAGAPLEAPTRGYSQGMLLRLAFAVSTLDQPELLLVDEGFLVGDLAFRARARERVGRLREAGAALLLAGHDHELIRQECDRVLWMERGRIRAEGPTDQVLDAYHAGLAAAADPGRPAPGRGPTLVGTRSRRPGAIRAGQCLDLVVTVAGAGAGAGFPRGPGDDGFELGVRLFDASGTELWGGSAPGRFQGAAGVRELGVTFPALPLAPGRYRIEIGFRAEDGSWCRRYPDAFAFQVVGEAGTRGPLRLEVRWDEAAEVRAQTG